MDLLVLSIVCVLCLIGAVLMIVRFIIYHGQRPPVAGIEIGKCMTIGSREVQEDHFAVVEAAPGTLAVLADGMGKLYGGKVASRLACEAFTEIFSEYNAFDNPQYFFRRAFNSANRQVLNKLDEQRGSASVAAAIIKRNKLYYALVGNIKIAVYRDQDLIPVSDGHTVDKLAEKKYLAGQITRQDAVALLERHRLYNYVGQDGFQDIELYDTPWPLRAGDIVVLMSDGLFDCVAWREIEDIMCQAQDCDKTALDLVEAVNQSAAEDKDNASVVLLRYQGDGK